MRGENEETVFLKDYAETPYAIEKVELDVRIAPDTSVIRAMLTLVPRANTAPGTPLVLDGEELPQALTAYEATATGLTIHQPPNKRFVLETEVAVEPEKNIRLMGFYRSSGTWCTQCEPEGFRRITYYLDRPDVLAPFKVRMTADRVLAPIRLAWRRPTSP